MFKKAMALMLCAAMLLTGASGALATVVPDGAYMIYQFGNESISSIAAIGSTLYVLYENGKLCARPVTTDEQVELGEVYCTAYMTEYSAQEGDAAAFDTLFVYGGQLHAFCTATGDVYRVLNDQQELAPELLPNKLDTSVLIEKDEEYSSVQTLTSLFEQDGWLYFTYESYAGGYKAYAGRISLETGENKLFETPNMTSLAPYKDGQVLAIVYDASGLYSISTTGDASSLEQGAQYGVFTPDTDTIDLKGTLGEDGLMGGYGINRMCYGNNTMYYQDGSRIMGVDVETGETRISAYTGEGMYSSSGNSLTLYADGYHVTFNYDGLRVMQLDSDAIQGGALTIFGEFGSDAHTSFAKNHPEIPVDVSSEYTADMEELTQAMVSGDNAYDVLKLSMTYMPVDRLIEKGYCADLSGYPELVALVDEMYPEYADAVKVDGKLFAVPVEMSAMTCSVDMAKWRELGLTEDDLPTSWEGWLDFAANWVYDYGEDHPDIPLFSYSDARQILFSVIFTQYMAYQQHMGEELRFNTERFLKLAKGIEAIDFDEINTVSDSDADAYWQPEALFSIAETISDLGMTFSYTADAEPKMLYLSLLEGDEPILAADVYVLTINPKTTRMEQAVTYLQNYLENLDKTAANITLYPDHNDPVERSSYESEKKGLEEELARLEQLLEAADETARAGLEDYVNNIKENLDWLEQHRYDVTVEQIEDFRQNVAPLISVQKQNTMYNASGSASTEIGNLLNQYLEGAITCEQMAEEIDKRVKLMQMEDA